MVGVIFTIKLNEDFLSVNNALKNKLNVQVFPTDI